MSIKYSNFVRAWANLVVALWINYSCDIPLLISEFDSNKPKSHWVLKKMLKAYKYPKAWSKKSEAKGESFIFFGLFIALCHFLEIGIEKVDWKHFFPNP